jgi:hypothetical protein
MSNLQKFNITLEDFDKEVGKLKAVSDAYQKLEGLTVAYNDIIKQFDQNSKALDKINELQKTQQEKVTKSLNDLENTNKQNKIDISKEIKGNFEGLQIFVIKSLADIENTNKQNKIDISKEIKGNFDVLQILHNDFSKNINKQIEELNSNNKTYYKDLEITLKNKLSDNKSEIKQLIENERNQIKQIFEIEFAKNTKELRQVIESEINKQTQLLLDNQKVIKVSLWVIGGLIIILSALAVFKLWTP